MVVEKNINNATVKMLYKNLYKQLITHSNFTFIFIYLLILITGLSIYKDFGISWDEPRSREIGLVTINHIQKVTGIKLFEIKENLPDLNNYIDKDYGSFFELLLIIVEKIAKLKDTREIYLLRHLLTFITFWISTIAFYKIAKIIFNNNILALLAALMLIISPRIFADAFYNSKDLAFLSFFNITVYFLLKFLKTLSWKLLFTLSFFIAALVNIRLAGIIIFAIAIFLLLLPSTVTNIKENITNKILKTLIFIILTITFTILLWPYLWEDPLDRFTNALSTMTAFNRWDEQILYRGEFINPAPPPWHYIPTWIGITTPVIYLLFFIIGIAFIFINLIKRPRAFLNINNKAPHTILILWIFIPYLSTIILKSTLYDGWRQMYFIYPPIILIACYGILSLLTFVKNKIYTKSNYYMLTTIIIIPLIINISIIISGMIKYHPNNQVYFNCLSPKNVSQKYELDYWGVSYKQLLEKLLEIDTSKEIKIKGLGFSAFANSFIIKPTDRVRLFYYLDDTIPKYFISNYRFKENFYNYQKNIYPYENELYSIKSWGNKISGIYKLKNKKL